MRERPIDAFDWLKARAVRPCPEAANTFYAADYFKKMASAMGPLALIARFVSIAQFAVIPK